MAWEIEGTDEFADWFRALDEGEREDVIASVDLLEARRTHLGFPHTSGVNGSRHGHRAAILLLGGDKTGDNRWYETHVPMADDLYDEHLDELQREGLL